MIKPNLYLRGQGEDTFLRLIGLISHFYSFATQVKKTIKKRYFWAQKLYRNAFSTKNQLLKFAALDISSIFIAFFIKQIFSNNIDCSSRLWFLVTLIINEKIALSCTLYQFKVSKDITKSSGSRTICFSQYFWHSQYHAISYKQHFEWASSSETIHWLKTSFWWNCWSKRNNTKPFTYRFKYALSILWVTRDSWGYLDFKHRKSCRCTDSEKSNLGFASFTVRKPFELAPKRLDWSSPQQHSVLWLYFQKRRVMFYDIELHVTGFRLLLDLTVRIRYPLETSELWYLGY